MTEPVGALFTAMAAHTDAVRKDTPADAQKPMVEYVPAKRYSTKAVGMLVVLGTSALLSTNVGNSVSSKPTEPTARTVSCHTILIAHLPWQNHACLVSHFYLCTDSQRSSQNPNDTDNKAETRQRCIRVISALGG